MLHVIRRQADYTQTTVKCHCACVLSCWVVSDSSFDPIDCSAPGSLSMGFCREEYWRRLPFSLSGGLPDPGIEPTLSCIPCVGRWILYHWATWEARDTSAHLCKWSKLRTLLSPNGSGMWSHRSSHSLLLVMQNGIATLEDGVLVSRKTNNLLI